jgi:RNase P/RNase MRP subunit p29
MKITQIVPVLKRVSPSVTGSVGLVVNPFINELVIRTRDDDIHVDLCR